jgi:hypothetical protein
MMQSMFSSMSQVSSPAGTVFPFIQDQEFQIKKLILRQKLKKYKFGQG